MIELATCNYLSTTALNPFRVPILMIIPEKKHISLKKRGGVQWLSGRVLDSGPRDNGFEPHRSLCVVVLEQDTFILA